MRAIAESAGKAPGGSMLVENKAGASGTLGPNELVKARQTATRCRNSPSASRGCRTCRRCS